ncbi:MAG TPA: FAD-dependent oxidoreductase [Solirubrobacteraceae bacterium]|nr:FAD-dependent oxidoreductase [Solirubrobacteraceae bacterium]
MAESGRRRQDLDVAIVGAGVSGVYTGWRLLAAGKARTVTIFEQSERIGGRLLSLEPPGMPGVWCELGGMRYTPQQPLVGGLIEELHLATHPFPVEEDANINYLRGMHIRQHEFSDPTTPIPYDLAWAEQGMNPDDLVSWAVEQVIPGALSVGAAKLRKFLETYMLEGRHVYDWGFWNLLARGLSHEGYELARASGGYDTPLLNWNALDTISLNADLAGTTIYNAVDGGYQSLPLTVAAKFQELGGTIELEHRLESFAVDGEGKVVLHVTDCDAGTRHEVHAGSLVLAMPRRSLELIAPTGPVLDPEVKGVRDLIESVTPIPLFKLCVAYPYPWWETVGVTQGRSLTDLPIRQCYYWATGHAHGDDPAIRNSVLLATYDDGVNVDFWNGYSDPNHHPPFETVENELTGALLTSDEWNKFKPTAAMVAEADRQLRELHGVRVAPKPYAAAYVDWGVDPFGGGVNFWNVHARSAKVIPAMIKPVPTVPVYVCGEAYSNGQGWVEGALETAELVLQEHFGLGAPAWVPA